MFDDAKNIQLLQVDEVAVAVGKWGEGFFHFAMEQFLRLVQLLDVFKTRPHVQIVVQRNSFPNSECEFLELIGVSCSQV